MFIKNIKILDFETDTLTGRILTTPINLKNDYDTSILFTTPLDYRKELDSELFDEILDKAFYGRNVYVIMDYGYEYEIAEWELVALNWEYDGNWCWENDWDEGQQNVRIHGILNAPETLGSYDVKHLFVELLKKEYTSRKNNFRQLQNTLGNTRPIEGTLYINDARITIDNWTVRDERIYIYYEGKYLFTIENHDSENVEYKFLI